MSVFLLKKDIRKVADPVRAKISQRFFKTGKGQYGEGDIFCGITVPDCRAIAKRFAVLPFNDIAKLLQSKIHEERLIGLLILVFQFNAGDERKRKEIYQFYFKHVRWVNNWDLVDLSADKIVGQYLFEHPKERTVLKKLAKSNNIWERRIAIVSTYYSIKQEAFNDTVLIADMLLHDSHDLIHKAVGWMLREVGKRSLATEQTFLRTRYKTMPRTMLRYAIERFPLATRRAYLRGQIGG